MWSLTGRGCLRQCVVSDVARKRSICCERSWIRVIQAGSCPPPSAVVEGVSRSWLSPWHRHSGCDFHGYHFAGPTQNSWNKARNKRGQGSGEMFACSLIRHHYWDQTCQTQEFPWRLLPRVTWDDGKAARSSNANIL